MRKNISDLKRMEKEMVDVIDRKNRVIGKVTKREIRERILWHRASSVLVFSSKGEILVCKRASTRYIDPGKYEMGAGGTVSSGEDVQETARREMEEEVGIRNVKLKFLFRMPFDTPKNKHIDWVYSCVYDGKIRVDGTETESYFFISIEKLLRMMKDDPEIFTEESFMLVRKYLKHSSKKR